MALRPQPSSLVLGLAVVWLGARLVSLPTAAATELRTWPRVQTALTEPWEQRVFASTGIAREELAALRILGQDGRLVVFGDPAVVPPAQRDYAAFLLEQQHHRLRSLLYPHPSDTCAARNPEELRRALAAPCRGTVVVADLSLTGAPLPAAGSSQLLHEQHHPGILVRYWRWSPSR